MTTHTIQWNGPASIPDGHPCGLQVFQSLSAPDIERITKVELRVRASHPRITDLGLLLSAPDGTSAKLHNVGRNCTHDLDKAWVLDHFNGHTPSGEWSLTVLDVATGHHGSLDRWEMVIHTADAVSSPSPSAPCPTRKITQTNNCSVSIPDADRKGVISSVEIDDPGKVQNVRVGVVICHSYVGDLSLSLVSPDGREMRLAPLFGKGEGTLKRTFTLSDSDALRSAIDTPAHGTWALRIRDLLYFDSGILDSWTLDLVVA